MPSTKGWGQQMAGLKRLVFALCAAGALAGYGGGAATAQDQGVAIVEAREADAAAPKSAEIPTAAFATRSAVQAVALSPDGSKLAMRTFDSESSLLRVIDTRTQERLHVTRVGSEETAFEWFQWAGNDKLLIGLSAQGSAYGMDIRYRRLVAWDLASGESYHVGLRRMGILGDDVIHVADDGSEILLAAQKRLDMLPEVYRIALEPNADAERVQKSHPGIWSWVADDNGVVRLGLGRSGRKLKVRYRADEESSFKTIAKLGDDDEDARFWEVARIVSGTDRGYILHEGEDGRIGLRAVDYATGEVGETVYENPDWDLTDVMLGEDGEPLAVYYTDDRDRIVWLQEEERRLQSQLEAALRGKEVRIVERAANDSMLLVSSAGANDPGALYLFDPAKRELILVSEFRPAIDEGLLAEPREITYAARDGTPIRAVLTLPRDRPAQALPLIVLPHGGPYGVRDKLVYSDEPQLLANRGYAVIQPNYRGSGGYGQAFYEAGYGQIGRKMQDDLDDAMDWAVGEGIADPARVCVVGSSYGGYAALYAVLRNPERYRCAASFAGVTDWDKQIDYDRQFLTRKAGRSLKDRVVGDKEHDFDIDTVSAYRLASTLSRPVMVAHGKQDWNVPFEQYELFIRATNGSDLVHSLVFEEEGHGFAEQENEQAWYDGLLGFLRTYNPPD